MRIRIDLDKLTLDTLITLQDAASIQNLSEIKPILAAFLADDAGEPLPEEEALRAVGKLRLSELSALLNQLGEEIQAALLPPASGGAS